MNRDQNAPGTVPDTNPEQANFESFPDVTPRREGGDDALAESSPTDSRSDEKVIAREKRGESEWNVPSQAVANTNEVSRSDDETTDDDR